MINDIKAAKSCLDVIKVFTDTNGYGLAVDGTECTPATNETYIYESYVVNDNEQGLPNSASQIQLPIYQLSVFVPKSQNKWALGDLVESVKAVFARGSDISNDSNQKVIIESVDSSQAKSTETHLYQTLRVNLTIIG